MMTKFRITYHMENRKETAETCIDVPMSEDNAAFFRAYGINATLKPYGEVLHSILHNLAKLQGYTFTRICAIEEVKDGEC